MPPKPVKRGLPVGDDSLSRLNRSQKAAVTKRRDESASDDSGSHATAGPHSDCRSSDESSAVHTGDEEPLPTLKSSRLLSSQVIYKYFCQHGKSFANTRRFFQAYDGGYKVSNGSIQQAVKTVETRKARETAAVPEPLQIGRPKKLDVESYRQLHAAADRERNRNALIRPTVYQCWQIIDIIYWKQQQRLSRQEHIRRPSMRHAGKLFNMDTYHKIVNTVWPEVDVVDRKAQAREDAKAEPRNMISAAAVGQAEFAATNPDAIFSSDIFTLQRNERGQSCLVRMAAGSKKKMKAMGLTAGYKDDAAGEAFRVLPIMATIAMSGHLLSAIAIVYDDQLPDGKFDIIALDSMGGAWDNAVMFVCYCGPNVPEEVLYHAMFSRVVFPKSLKRVAECKAMLRGGVKRPATRHFSLSPEDASRIAEKMSSPSTSASHSRNAASQQPSVPLAGVSVHSNAVGGGSAAAAVLPMPMQSSPFPQPLPPRHLPASLDTEWDPIHCFDGDCPQVKACLNREAMRKHGLATLLSIALRLDIRLLKWAAGCSMLLSPNDKGAMHYLAKNAFKVGVYDTMSVDNSNTPIEMRNHKCYFDALPLPPASKKTFWSLLSNMPWILNRAFTVATIRSGWEKCGYYPTVSAAAIMEQWSGWSDGTLTAEQSNQVMAAIDGPRAPLVVVARSCGRTADLEIDRLLPFLAPVFSIAHALEEMGYHRERTVCFSNADYMRSRQETLQQLLEANPNMPRTGAAARMQGQPARPPASVIWFCNPANVLNPPTALAIIDQLSLRRIEPSRKNSAKAKLLEQWMNHDANPSSEFWQAHRREIGAPKAPPGAGGGNSPARARSPRVASPGRAAVVLLSPRRSPVVAAGGAAAISAVAVRERSRSR